MAKKRRCIIKLIPDSESSGRIEEFLEANKGVVADPKLEFHTTVYYAEEFPLFKRKQSRLILNSAGPITIDPETYSLEVFGDGFLVIRYKDGEIDQLNQSLRREAYNQSVMVWPDLNLGEREIFREYDIRESPIYRDFNPHVTLAQGFDKRNLDMLPDFREPITFDSYTWKI